MGATRFGRLFGAALSCVVMLLPARRSAAAEDPAAPPAASVPAPPMPTPAAAPAGEPAAPAPATPAPTSAPGALTVDQVIDQALERNFGVRLARHDLAAAQSTVRAERNAFGYKLFTHFTEDSRYVDDLQENETLDMSVDRETRWGGKFSFGTLVRRTVDRTGFVSDDHSANLVVGYRQPLWGGFGRRVATASLVASEVALRESARSLAADEMRLVVDATRAFYDVVRRRTFIRIDQDAVARAEENLRTYKVRLEEGLITSIDAARAESEVRQRENTVVQDEEEYRSARDRLAFLLGLPVGTPLELADLPPQLAPLDIADEAAVDEAKERRADLRNEHEVVALAELSTHVARSSTRPRLDLETSLGHSSFWESSPFVNETTSGAVRVDLVYTFGERSDDEALVRARIAEEQARIRLEELERTVELQVRDAVREVRALERRIELLHQNLDLARESLRLAQLQLQEDLIRTTDLLQIQGDLVRAETDYTEAIAEHAVAVVNLELALGRYRTTGAEHPSSFLRDTPSVAPELGPITEPLPIDRSRMPPRTRAPQRPPEATQ